MSACRKYVQLLLGFGFGGVKICPIHEQSRLRLTKNVGSVIGEVETSVRCEDAKLCWQAAYAVD